MRNDALTKLLVGLVILSVLVTSGFAFLYVRSVQKMNRLQLQAALVNRNRALVNSFAAEAVEYSRRDPTIDPLLQSLGIKAMPKSTPGQPTRTQPAASPR